MGLGCSRGEYRPHLNQGETAIEMGHPEVENGNGMSFEVRAFRLWDPSLEQATAKAKY